MGRKAGKKDKDRVADEFEKLENEMISNKVKEIFRTQPDNYISGLEDIGFEYREDDEYEEKEEREAKPENRNQRDLVAFFEGRKPLMRRSMHCGSCFQRAKTKGRSSTS